MKSEVKMYVEFYFPGIFVSESSIKEINSLDPKLIEWPKHAFAFKLFKREEATINGKTLRGDMEAVSGMYYTPDSKVETLEEVKESHPQERILISNMTYNDWNKIVWIGNNAQPFNDEKDAIWSK